MLLDRLLLKWFLLRVLSKLSKNIMDHGHIYIGALIFLKLSLHLDVFGINMHLSFNVRIVRILVGLF
jgi:hypothetical protein